MISPIFQTEEEYSVNDCHTAELKLLTSNPELWTISDTTAKMSKIPQQIIQKLEESHNKIVTYTYVIANLSRYCSSQQTRGARQMLKPGGFKSLSLSFVIRHRKEVEYGLCQFRSYTSFLVINMDYSFVVSRYFNYFDDCME